MSCGALRAELSAIRQEAERSAKKIEQIRKELHVEESQIRQVVDNHATKWLALLVATLESRGLTWCTLCSEQEQLKARVFPVNDMSFLLIKDHISESVRSGHQIGFALQRACPACAQKALDEHGLREFRAFMAERRHGRYWARYYGNWIKVTSEQCLPFKVPYQLIWYTPTELGLPPRLEFGPATSFYGAGELLAKPKDQQASGTVAA